MSAARCSCGHGYPHQNSYQTPHADCDRFVYIHAHRYPNVYGDRYQHPHTHRDQHAYRYPSAANADFYFYAGFNRNGSYQRCYFGHARPGSGGHIGSDANH